jgi:hypothetical protein
METIVYDEFTNLSQPDFDGLLIMVSDEDAERLKKDGNWITEALLEE